MAPGSTQPLPEMSTRNLLGSKKSGRRVGLTTLPPSMSRTSENVGASTSRNPKGLHGLYGGNFTFYLNWTAHLEFLWPFSTPYSWIILPFKDDESYVDPESSYAPSRRVSGCPSTEFGVRIALKTQALPDTVDFALDFLTVNFGRTPHQYNHDTSLASRACVLLVNLNTSSSVQFNTSLEATCRYYT
jgi:hypothetical protein